MTIDPIVAALATVVSTLAGFLYRALVKRAEDAEKRTAKAEADAAWWRDKYLIQVGMTELATDAAEKRTAQ